VKEKNSGAARKGVPIIIIIIRRAYIKALFQEFYPHVSDEAAP
jgi:hypothetical protein